MTTKADGTETVLTDFIKPSARQEDESQAQYRRRKALETRLIRNVTKLGTLVHQSVNITEHKAYNKSTGKVETKLLRTPSTMRVGKKIERNAKCTCGSGKKYKKCCLKA